MEAIGGKWKILILWYLRSEEKRFNELQKSIYDNVENEVIKFKKYFDNKERVVFKSLINSVFKG